MSHSSTNPTPSASSPSPKSPSHIAYHVRDVGEKSFWTRIGCAWPHADGNGFNVQLECVPLDGRVSLRIASDRKE